MTKYPFQPDFLESMPEPLANVMRCLEEDVLGEICSRLQIAGEFNEVAIDQIRVLRSHGIDLEDIKRAVGKYTGIGQERLTELIDDAVARNKAYNAALADAAGLTLPLTFVGESEIDAIRRQTEDAYRNLTRSMGFLVDGGRTMLEPAQAYQWALDRAELQITSGSMSYEAAIRDAVKQLADSGLKSVSYESGWVNQLDVAVRRAAMTGVSQICDKYTEQSAEFLGTHYYEVSAHTGARDTDGPNGWENHKRWQGKVYSDRDGDIYPNIYKVCGLGSVTGLEGANCRHRRWPFVPGVSERTYTDEELQNIDPPPFTYEGRTYTTYEARQKQRQIESTMRQLRRERIAYDAAGLDDDVDAVTARMKRLDNEYRNFSKAAGLREHREQMNIQYIDEASDLKAARLKVKRAEEAAVREAIKRGDYPLQINPEKQARHMAETAPAGRSVITISLEELQEIINSKAGTGELDIKGTNIKQILEIVDAGREIGYTNSKKNGIIKARYIKIHYSKTGTHAVPYSAGEKT